MHWQLSWNLKFDFGFFNAFLLEKYYITRIEVVGETLQGGLPSNQIVTLQGSSTEFSVETSRNMDWTMSWLIVVLEESM